MVMWWTDCWNNNPVVQIWDAMILWHHCNDGPTFIFKNSVHNPVTYERQVTIIMKKCQAISLILFWLFPIAINSTAILLRMIKSVSVRLIRSYVCDTSPTHAPCWDIALLRFIGQGIGLTVVYPIKHAYGFVFSWFMMYSWGYISFKVTSLTLGQSI